MICTTENAEQRFWSKVDKDDPSGCWIWQGGKTKLGYGFLMFKGETRGAHRVSYMLVHGSFPDLGLDHLCRNPSCVNPDHLEPVTQRENILRGTAPAAVNAAKTHCDHGHEFTPENTYSRIAPSGFPTRGCRACGIRRRREWRQRVRARGGKPS